MHTPRTATLLPAVSAAVLLLLVFAALSPAPAGADHLAADKVAVAASDVQYVTVPLEGGAAAEFVALLNVTMRTSDAVDLILQLTYECAIWTEVGVVGSGGSEAAVQVMSVITIDGEAIPTAPGGDEIAVTFCNRVHGLSVLNGDDPDQRLENYLTTKAANAFNWAAVDVPAGVHDIVVAGVLVSYVDGVGHAQAAVGSRTLVVEPVRLSPHT